MQEWFEEVVWSVGMECGVVMEEGERRKLRESIKATNSKIALVTSVE